MPWDRLYNYLIAEQIISPQGEWLRGALLPPLELCDAQKARLAQVFGTPYCVKVAKNDGSSVEVVMQLDEFIQGFDHYEIEIVGGGVDWILGREFYEPFLRKLGVPDELLSDDLFAEMSALPQDIDIRFAVPYIEEGRLIDAATPLFNKLASSAGIDLDECINAHKQKWAAKPGAPDKYAIVTLELCDAAKRAEKVVDIDFLFEKQLRRQYLNKRDAHGLQVKIPLNGTATLISDLPCAEEAFVHYITRRLDAGADKAFNLNGVAMTLVSTTKGRFPCVPTYFSTLFEALGRVSARAIFDKISSAVDKHAKGQPLAIQAALYNAFYFLGEKRAKELVQRLKIERYAGGTLVEQLLRAANSSPGDRCRVESLAAVHAIIGWGAGAVANRKDEHTIELQCREGSATYSLFLRKDVLEALHELGQKVVWDSLAPLSANWATSATLEGLPLDAAHRDAIDRIAALEAPAAKHLAFLLLLKYHSQFPSTTTANLALRRYDRICGLLSDRERENAARLLGEVLVAHPATYGVESMLILRDKLNQDPGKLADALRATKNPVLTGKVHKMKGGKKPAVATPQPAVVIEAVKAEGHKPAESSSSQPQLAQQPSAVRESQGVLDSRKVDLLLEAIDAAQNLEKQRTILIACAKNKGANKHQDALITAFDRLNDSALPASSKLSLLFNRDMQRLLKKHPDRQINALLKLSGVIHEMPLGTRAQAAALLCKNLAVKASKGGCFPLPEEPAMLLGDLLTMLSAAPATLTPEMRQELLKSLEALFKAVDVSGCHAAAVALLSGCHLCKLTITLPPGKSAQLCEASMGAMVQGDIRTLASAENAYLFACSCMPPGGQTFNPTDVAAFAQAWLRNQSPTKACGWILHLKCPHACALETADALLKGAYLKELETLLMHNNGKLFEADVLAKLWLDYASQAELPKAAAVFQKQKQHLEAHLDPSLVGGSLREFAERCHADGFGEGDALQLLLDYGRNDAAVVLKLAQACKKRITAQQIGAVIGLIDTVSEGSSALLIDLLEASARLQLSHPSLLPLLNEEAFAASPFANGSDGEVKILKKLLFGNGLRCLREGAYRNADFERLNTYRRKHSPSSKETELLSAILCHPEMPAAASALPHLWKQKAIPKHAQAPYAAPLLRALLIHRPAFDGSDWTDFCSGLFHESDNCGLTKQEFGDAVIEYVTSALKEADRRGSRPLRVTAFRVAIRHLSVILQDEKCAYPHYEIILRALPHLLEDGDTAGTYKEYQEIYKALTDKLVLPVPKSLKKERHAAFLAEKQLGHLVAVTESLLSLDRSSVQCIGNILLEATQHLAYVVKNCGNQGQLCLNLLDKFLYCDLFWKEPKWGEGEIGIHHYSYCGDLLKTAAQQKLFVGRELLMVEHAALIDGKLTFAFPAYKAEQHMQMVALALTKLLQDPRPSKVDRAFHIFKVLGKNLIYIPDELTPCIQRLTMNAVIEGDETATLDNIESIARFLAQVHVNEGYPKMPPEAAEALKRRWIRHTPALLEGYFLKANSYHEMLKESESPNIKKMFDITKIANLGIDKSGLCTSNAELHDRLNVMLLRMGLDCHDPLVEPDYYNDKQIQTLIEEMEPLSINRMVTCWMRALDGSHGVGDIYLSGRLLRAIDEKLDKMTYKPLFDTFYNHIHVLTSELSDGMDSDPHLMFIKMQFINVPTTAEERIIALQALGNWIEHIYAQKRPRSLQLEAEAEILEEDLAGMNIDEIVAWAISSGAKVYAVQENEKSRS